MTQPKTHQPPFSSFCHLIFKLRPASFGTLPLPNTPSTDIPIRTAPAQNTRLRTQSTHDARTQDTRGCGGHPTHIHNPPPLTQPVQTYAPTGNPTQAAISRRIITSRPPPDIEQTYLPFRQGKRDASDGLLPVPFDRQRKTLLACHGMGAFCRHPSVGWPQVEHPPAATQSWR